MIFDGVDLNVDHLKHMSEEDFLKEFSSPQMQEKDKGLWVGKKDREAFLRSIYKDIAPFKPMEVVKPPEPKKEELKADLTDSHKEESKAGK